MRLIDAAELKRLYTFDEMDFSEDKWHVPVRVILQNIDDMPTIDPVKHGRWMYNEGETIEDGGYCSVCGRDQPMFIEDWEWKYVETDFCPHCSARMDAFAKDIDVPDKNVGKMDKEAHDLCSALEMLANKIRQVLLCDEVEE